jgi:hypothetical protein
MCTMAYSGEVMCVPWLSIGILGKAMCINRILTIDLSGVRPGL